MENSAEATPEGRPLSNVGVIGKTIIIALAPSVTNEQVDLLVRNVLERRGIPDEVHIIYYKDEVMICAKPICPYCDMDFGFHDFLGQHLDQRECMTS